MPRPFGGLGRRFPGFVTFFFGAILPFPLAPLPRLPIILPPQLFLGGESELDLAPLRSTPLLALPWYADSTSPPPPLSPVLGPGPAPMRRGRRPTVRPPQRASTRITARDTGAFVDSTARAVNRKAIRESLASCSDDLKKQVSSRRLLKRKNPLAALDLSRLAKAADLRCSDRRAVAVAAATGGFS